MSTKRIKGRDLRIFKVDESGSASAEAYAYATSCSLSVTANTEKVVDKDTSITGEQEMTGVDWNMRSDNIVASDLSNLDKVLDPLLKGEHVYVAFTVVSNANPGGVEVVTKWEPGKGYFGKALVTNVDANAPSEGNGTFSATFTGSGELKKINGGL